ncbi:MULTISPECIES: DUF3088 domain-containing protein [Thalassospira]|uniref:DUF3088 domain-containing protein n=1 Tax=Thalassospira TaxID=168934 RepID=UPI000ACDCA05|nr:MULTISPECIES: DUF3088 domain-containing protein [Thalassospira]
MPDLERDTIFLLKPDFEDPAWPNQRFYCWHCALIDGVLGSFPDLHAGLDIRHINWPRPRQDVIALLGEDHQSLPVMILKSGDTSSLQTGIANGHAFIDDKDSILLALSERHGFPVPHP